MSDDAVRSKAVFFLVFLLLLVLFSAVARAQPAPRVEALHVRGRAGEPLILSRMFNLSLP